MKADAASQRLTYRVFEESDLSGVLKLWEEAGWGRLTADTWRQWFQETPYGPCLVVVASDEQHGIVAQEVFSPCEVLLDSRRVPALRISAPIVSRRCRRVSLLGHPVVRLLGVATEIAGERGCQVIYSLPHHTWLPFFRQAAAWGISSLPFELVEYPCVRLRLDRLLESSRSGSLIAIVEDRYGSEFDELWDRAVTTLPIAYGVLRPASWVKFKNGGHITLAVRDRNDGTLVGYTATRRRDSLMVDALATNTNDMHRVIAASASWLADHGEDDQGIRLRELKVMESSVIPSTIRSLGFEEVPFTFVFACAPVGSASVSPSPDRWFITPGD